MFSVGDSQEKGTASKAVNFLNVPEKTELSGHEPHWLCLYSA